MHITFSPSIRHCCNDLPAGRAGNTANTWVTQMAPRLFCWCLCCRQLHLIHVKLLLLLLLCVWLTGCAPLCVTVITVMMFWSGLEDPLHKHLAFITYLAISGCLHATVMLAMNLWERARGGPNGNPEHIYGDIAGW